MFMCTTDALRNNIKPYELEYIAIMNILKHGQAIASIGYLSFKSNMMFIFE